jgi:hypothetical protein
MVALSHQGISDRVARDYMDVHGCIRWREIDCASCLKLQNYWHFYGCLYHKMSGTCAEPDHIAECPLPTHVLRNGRLNQTAYSLYLFIRDIADNDLVGWIDAQLSTAAEPIDTDRLGRMRNALIDPLRHVVVRRADGGSQVDAALGRGWCQHDRDRHARSQLSRSHRRVASVRG